jgi:hypothetical protein
MRGGWGGNVSAPTMHMQNVMSNINSV